MYERIVLRSLSKSRILFFDLTDDILDHIYDICVNWWMRIGRVQLSSTLDIPLYSINCIQRPLVSRPWSRLWFWRRFGRRPFLGLFLGTRVLHHALHGRERVGQSKGRLRLQVQTRLRVSELEYRHVVGEWHLGDHQWDFPRLWEQF